MSKLSEKQGNIEGLLPFLILIITAVVFSNSLTNEFINLDDPQYVTQNEQVKELSIENIQKIFSSYTHGHYQPLSVLTYAVDHAFYGMNATGFRVTNLLLHLISVLLVFYFLRRITGKSFVALIVTLLFAVHPLRVESVVWISERKDVLYAVFFLAAMLCYLNFLDNRKQARSYLLTLLFFTLSLLAKSMAVTLPLVLLLLDWYQQRKWSLRWITEKIPFFVLSIVFGIIVIQSQAASGLLEETTGSYNFLEKLLLSAYAAVIYIYKTLIPSGTLFMTDYPEKINGHLPYIYYVVPLIIAALILGVAKLKKFQKELVFGLLFYLVTISVVLQIIPVSGYLWDHYTYLPSIGILFLIGQFYRYLDEKRFSFSGRLKMPFMGLIGFLLLISIFTTWNRNQLWKNSGTLFSEVIRQQPKNESAYYNRGLYRLEHNQYAKAEKDFSSAIELSPGQAEYYLQRGIAKKQNRQRKEALQDFNKSIKIEPSVKAYIERGTLKANAGYHQRAISDFKSAIELNEDSDKAWNNLGLSHGKTGNMEKALDALNKAVEINPQNANAYGNRGTVYFKTGHKTKACRDWKKSAELGNKKSLQIFRKMCQ
ncbi:MAG: tetratricopeptide repeat protein [Bacteroidales bacterium]|nr:tetratricopeptide repeat protein [Bacteroidales bacterium]